MPTTLWVVPVSNLAGVARHVLDVARVGLPGWELVVAAPEGPLLERLRELGTPTVVAEIQPGVRVDRAVRALRRVILDLRPDVVHTHLARADILAALATVGTGVRLVSTEHTIPQDRFAYHHTYWSAVAMETVHHLRLTRFDALIACCESAARSMRAYWRPAQPVTVIRNGVDRPEAPAVRGPGTRFLALSRLSPEKNVETTLRAFARIRAAEPGARLTVGGTGPELEALTQLASQLGVAEAVTFPGYLDAEAALASHDVILQPSRSENLSYALLDAVVAGLGVAASDVGGNPEILPPDCLAGVDDADRLADIALRQARDVATRPTLPPHIPTVAQMASEIVGVYERV